MSETMTFEEAMKQLETVVKELESGTLELSEMVTKFNKGMELTKICNDLLKDARELTVKLMEEQKEE